MGGINFDAMGNISKIDRKLLDEYFYISGLEISKKQISADGTVKYLFGLGDGNMIESVFMKYKHGNTVCISTQVGCRMGCAFCDSAIGGLSRDLLPSEMLLQVMAVQKDAKSRISNVVLMGIGEPLDNFDNTIKFLRLINDKNGLNIGYRHISVSTCGLVDKINKLKNINIPVTLSVSVHAPNDDIRNKLMPINNKWGVDALLEACRGYANHTKRRVSFEYVLIDGLNDSKDNARELAHKIKNILCHVNLIPLNRVLRGGFAPTGEKKARIFLQTLENCGINATVRRKCGDDINAACGQLKKIAGDIK